MGTVCRKTSQRKDRLSWHLPLRPSPPLSLRLMPIPTTTEDTVSDTAMVSMVATGHTVLDTAVVCMARGRLRPSPRLMPIPTTTEDTDMVATELTVSDTGTGSDTAVVSTATARGRLSPTTESTLPTTLLPLSCATPIMPSPPLLSLTPSTLSTPLSSPATPRSPPLPPSPPSALPPLPDATSPTPPEPSTLPRGRLRPTPTTTEDTDTEDMVSDTGDTVSDTAV